MSDFSTYTADQVADWMSQGTVATPPNNLYIALFDDQGTEVSGDFANDRVTTTTGTDWGFSDAEGTNFQNANEINFGAANVDVNNIQDVALYDDTLANGGNEIARYTIDDAPFSVASGSELSFNAGNLSFNVVQRT